MPDTQASVSMRTADLATAAILGSTAIGILLLVPSQIAGSSLADIGNVRSPAFFACLCGLALLWLAIAIGARALAAIRVKADTGTRIAIGEPMRLLAGIAVLSAATGAIFLVGLLVAGGLAIVALAIVFDYRNWFAVGIASIATPVFTYVLFERVLLVLLPRGIW